MPKKTIWVECRIEEAHYSQRDLAYSPDPVEYELIPVSYEVHGSLGINVKPQFLDAAITRIGGRSLEALSPEPRQNTPTHLHPRGGSREVQVLHVPDAGEYRRLEDGEMSEDLGGVVEKVTGRAPNSILKIACDVIEEFIRPRRRK